MIYPKLDVWNGMEVKKVWNGKMTIFFWKKTKNKKNKKYAKRTNTRRNAGCVAQWLAISARKPKVTGSSPAASYAQRWASCNNRVAYI